MKEEVQKPVEKKAKRNNSNICVLSRGHDSHYGADKGRVTAGLRRDEMSLLMGIKTNRGRTWIHKGKLRHNE